MTNAGWYPDPAGAPDTYRYWDGQSWSQMTTNQPPAASQPPAQQPVPQQPTAFPPAQPPAPQAPQPYAGGYGQQQWSPQPSGGSGSGGGNGKTIGIVIAAVLTLVLLGVGGFFGVRALTGDDGDDKLANDDPSQSESGTDEPTDPSSSIAPVGIQCTGGSGDAEEPPSPSATELKGGGLTLPRLDGYTVATGDDVAFSFPDAFVLQYVDVEDKWISLTGVGGLAKANGFDDVAAAAEVIVQCLSSDDKVYSGFTERTDLKNEQIEVDGKPAHRITSEIRVEDPRVTVEGDVLDVVVVDTGNPDSYGLYIGMAAIGNDELISTNEDLSARLSVD